MKKNPFAKMNEKKEEGKDMKAAKPKPKAKKKKPAY